MAGDSMSSPPPTFPAGDVVKQGYLYVKRPPRKYFSKMRAWHKRYLVLRDETQDRSPCLEMYEKDELLTAPLGITGPKLVLDLGQCVHIGFTSDSSRFPYALVIVCQGRSPLLLAAEDELSARSWLLALGLITHKGNPAQCPRTTFLPPPSLTADGTRRSLRSKTSHRDTCSLPQESSTSLSVESTAASLLPEEYNESSMDLSFAREIFQVTVNPTEDSQRLGMSGDLQLAVFSHGLGLAKTGMASCFVVWPVAYIRQYLHESTSTTSRTKTTIVTLEVGRRSSTGEGVFQFRTQRGQEIIRELKAIVELWSARKAVLSIQQSSVKQNDSVFFGNSPHRCQQWTVTGRSAPCTPSLAFPNNWQKRRLSPAPGRRSALEARTSCNAAVTNDERDTGQSLNYIVPSFEESPPSEMGNNKSPRIIGRKTVTADVGQDGCVRTKHTRIIGTCSLDSAHRTESSEECCYIEVDPGNVPRRPTPSSHCSPAKNDKAAPVESGCQEPEAYLEVLPT